MNMHMKIINKHIALSAFCALSISTCVMAEPKESAPCNHKHQRAEFPAEQRPEFSSLDSNSDKTISLEEFSTQPIPVGDHTSVFSKIDSNHDGLISEAEFKAHKPPHNMDKAR